MPVDPKDRKPTFAHFVSTAVLLATEIWGNRLVGVELFEYTAADSISLLPFLASLLWRVYAGLAFSPLCIYFFMELT